ncbi:MAG: prephenate dehydrogenase/arogenate dehydrogenase family protein [Deltaproteobacteria bacterium]|nr:MAG: prephenate dehydrogenase/arogenate dehydrogenase family protein [Deltaproteobacteria bacterium]
MTLEIERTVVIGTGLIGGSLAAAGRRAGVLRRVVGVGRGRTNLEQALAAGLVDEIGHDPVAAVAGADLVVLGAPVDSCLDLLVRIAPRPSEAAAGTDVGSVKAPLCRRAEGLGIGDRFVGGHPMAGGVGTGAALADAELFRGKVAVVTPTRESARDAVDLVRGLWGATGAEVLEMEPELHDRIVAASSHLPQMVAYCLAATVGAEPLADEVVRLAGAGIKDTTRLAASDADMWAAIAKLNREALADRMDAFAREWGAWCEAVRGGDEKDLRARIGRANKFKRRLNG